MSLEDDLGLLALDAAFWMEAVKDPDTPIDQLGDVCLDVEKKLRAIGSILLLTRGNTDGFLHNLIRAGKAWEVFLARCRREAPEDHNFCAGLFQPVLDAVAARDRSLATQLSTLAPDSFRAGHENEDDFAYARVLRGLLTGTAPENELVPILERCADAGDSMSAVRADVLRALLVRDAGAFHEAFGGLLAIRETKIADDRARGQVASPVVRAERRLYVEGIALLNLAEERGVPTELDYPACPSLARVPMVRPFTP